MSRHKGVHVLLEAFRGFGEADLVLYGRDHGDLDGYRDVLAQPNVDFRGVLRDADKSSAFAELDADRSFGVDAGSPLVIHEAFLAGVPVVTSNIGGMAATGHPRA